MNKPTIAAVLALTGSVLGSRAQLAITETMSSASTNLGPTLVAQGPDFWELSNFGSNTVDLTGYIFNDSDATRGGDADTTTLSGVSIGPGESIILVQSGTAVATRDDFINWWGAANVPTNLQVLFYSGNGQSSGGDSIVLWSPSATSDADYADRADFGEAVRGHSFTYDPTTGVYGIISSNGVNGAFKAVTADDEGSPGYTTGPAPLVITHQPTPTNATVPASSDVTFAVSAQGLPHPHYQWRHQGNPIDGAIESSLTVSNAQVGDSGQYSVLVYNGLTTIVSSNATLNVTTSPEAPVFGTVPKDADAYIGQIVQFTAQANGSPTPSFRWETNGVPIPGETSDTLTLNYVQTNQAATYTVVASNSVGTNSASATLTVGPKPQLMITELHSTGSSSGYQDWWELTSFDTRTFNLNGWRWDDSSHSLAPNNAYVFTNDIIIHPGESVVFVENLTPDQFRAWWGPGLPPGLQIVTYSGGGLGLSGTADEVNLWNAVTLPANALTERIAAVNFASCPVGVTFVYDPENPPVAGVMSVYSTNTVDGAAANGVFTASNGDVGSPGYVEAPILAQAGLNGGNLAVSWNSVSGRSYTVQYRDDLTNGGWSTLNTVPAVGATTSLNDPINQARRFYRVYPVIPFVSEEP
jgi:hypothetical protein